MNKECALYIRVSSDIQDYKRQISDLKKHAKENNFKVSDKHIYEDKLSGFKNEKERLGLNNLLRDVVEFNIKYVFVWELSRLARKHKDLLEVTDFFESNRINVYFYIQRFWLLDENGKKSPQAGLSIAVFGWQAEYEARLTKERFISAKKHNESIGKYNGGFIKFGYTLDDNNNYVLNTKPIEGLDVSESDIVKEVFGLYEEGLTCSKICMIARSKNYPKIVCSTHTLARLLRDTSYIGYKNTKLGKRPMPKLISEAQFDTVRELIETNKTKADKGKKHVYLLRGVLKCSYCDSYYVGKQTDDSYICPQNSGSNKTNKGTFCKGNNISVSSLDGIVWKLIKSTLLLRKVKEFDDTYEGNRIEIAALKTQISNYQNLLDKLEKERKNTNIMFRSEGYTVAEYQSEIKRIKNEREICKKEIVNIESKLRYYEKIERDSQAASKRLEKIEAITDRHQMQTIIKSLIREIYFYKITSYKTVVFIQFTNGRYDWLAFNSVAKKGNTFKLLNANYIRFDKSKGCFYILNEVNKLKYWELKDENKDGRILIKSDTHISKQIDPIPDESNANKIEFDELMNLQDRQYVLDSIEYSKITYFKELNKARFNRRKSNRRNIL